MILDPPAYEDGTDSIPKRRLLELRRRGIAQKKTHYKINISTQLTRTTHT